MTPNLNLRQLHEAGVSIWLDSLSRELLDSGEFAELVVEPGDLPNAVEWGSVAKRAVGASLVVVVDPVWP